LLHQHDPKKTLIHNHGSGTITLLPKNIGRQTSMNCTTKSSNE
jgi:hypothetical protein